MRNRKGCRPAILAGATALFVCDIFRFVEVSSNRPGGVNEVQAIFQLLCGVFKGLPGYIQKNV